MRPRLLAAVALPASLWLQTGPAAAQYCDNLRALLPRPQDRLPVRHGHPSQRQGLQTGAQVEVSSKLIKNKFLPDTYDIDRSGKPAAETLSCK